jgi:hypothetical protein
MADIVIDGRVRVDYLPTVSNIAAPTTAEYAAGTQLTLFLAPTGLEGFEPAQAEVDNTSMASNFDTHLPGRLSYSNTRMIFKKQDGTDAIFNLLVPDTNGVISIRTNGVLQTTAPTTGQLVRMYPGRAGEAYPMGIGESNALERFVVPWTISSRPNLRAVIA